MEDALPRPRPQALRATSGLKVQRVFLIPLKTLGSASLPRRRPQPTSQPARRPPQRPFDPGLPLIEQLRDFLLANLGDEDDPDGSDAEEDPAARDAGSRQFELQANTRRCADFERVAMRRGPGP